MSKIIKHIIFGCIISVSTGYICIAVEREYNFSDGEELAQLFLWLVVNIAQWIWNALNISFELDKLKRNR